VTEASRTALACLVVIAGIFDIRSRRIPNWLNVMGMAAGFALNVYAFGLEGLKAASFGMLLAAAVYLALYLLRGMGAGDVKLMAAVGAIAGPRSWFAIFIATALAGGIIGLLVVIAKGRMGETALNLNALMGELIHFRVPAQSNRNLDVRSRQGLRLPHGLAIAPGSLAFVFWG